MLALAGGSPERTSLLADLRKEAAVGATGFYDYDVWECERVAEGSATVAWRMAEPLGSRVRYGSPVRRIEVRGTGCTVTGEQIASGAVVSALPVGPLRDVDVRGVSEERLASLRAPYVDLRHRRGHRRTSSRRTWSDCTSSARRR